MSRVRFEIVPPIDRGEEALRVVGNHRDLGNWDPARSAPLRWEAPFHVGTIDVEAGTRLEFKVVRDGWESEMVDAWGSVPENWTHEVWMDGTVRRTVADWKDRYAGRLTTDAVRSEVLAGERELLIWLPPSYSVERERRFPVVVFFDGRNVFDPATSPLSGVDWAADEWVRVLAVEGAMPEAIVVGVCHPEGFGEGMTSLREGDLSLELGGEGFARFVATELVPYLDTHYRTLPSAGGRILVGGGLGGLNALATALWHPDVFGKVAGFSTSFEDLSQSLPDQSRMLRELAERAALPDGVRMYFDYGTEGIDECYAPYHVELATIFRERGWEDGREFRVVRVNGGSHSEASWRLRLGEGLRFLGRF